MACASEISIWADTAFSAEAEDIEMVDSMLIDVSTLRAATGDFAESNKLGEGGFGTVYKVVRIKASISWRFLSSID
jgi:hypothetical protein